MGVTVTSTETQCATPSPRVLRRRRTSLVLSGHCADLRRVGTTCPVGFCPSLRAAASSFLGLAGQGRWDRVAGHRFFGEDSPWRLHGGPTRLCRGHLVFERAVHLRWFRGLCHLPRRGPHGNSTGQSARRWTMHSGRFGLGDGCLVHASSSLAQFKYVRALEICSERPALSTSTFSPASGGRAMDSRGHGRRYSWRLCDRALRRGTPCGGRSGRC